MGTREEDREVSHDGGRKARSPKVPFQHAAQGTLNGFLCEAIIVLQKKNIEVKPPEVLAQEEQARIAAAIARRVEKNEKRQERKSKKHKREHEPSETTDAKVCIFPLSHKK
jgi:hypothetical protein